MSTVKEPFILPQALRDQLISAQSWVVLTGAGVSAESGVPTFRDAQEGLWAKYRPEELASAEGFARDPKMVWDWYQWRRELINKVKPNAGHHALAEIEQSADEFLLVTQNVDSLHQAAGSQKVVELHGNIYRNICTQTGRDISDEWMAQHPSSPVPSPHASAAFARPGVVWFGESLPQAAFEQAISALNHCDLMLVAGTSGLVQPAASLPQWAQQQGACVVEINPEQTPISAIADYRLAGTSAQWLPVIAKNLKGKAY